MATFERYSVVLVDFPFSDLSNSKLRPALVLAQANNEDWFLCQITSNTGIDSRAIEIKNTDFEKGFCSERVLRVLTKFLRDTKV